MGYFCILYNMKATFLAFVIMFLFPIISLFILQRLKKKIRITMTAMPDVINKSGKGKVQMCVINDSIFPIAKLEVDIFYRNSLVNEEGIKRIQLSILGKNTQEIYWDFQADYAGNIKFEVEKVTFWDYTKCFKKHIKMNAEKSICVLPSEVIVNQRLREGGFRLFENETVLLHKPGDEPTDILDIREYKEGDRLSRVHWKLTEKQDQLMIKEYMRPLYYYPIILFDLRIPTATDKLQRMDILCTTLQSLVLWHTQREYSFEIAYYNLEMDDLVLFKIESINDYYEFLRQAYDNAYEEKESKCLRAFYKKDITHRYSNIVYLTAELDQEITLAEEMKAYCIVVGNEEEVAREAVRLIHSTHANEDITQIISEYLSGKRGGYYENKNEF